MEEILASIRRIIADDETKPDSASEAVQPAAAAPTPRQSPPPAPPPGAPPPESAAAAQPLSSDLDPLLAAAETPAPDVLDLTEDMAASPQHGPSDFRTIDGQPDVVFTETPPEHDRSQEQEDRDGRLLSGSASAAVDSAFNSLAQTVLVHNARTLEDLVREMLRPMLKSWLDDNLPGLVERLVRAEIERVSRGR